MQVLHQLPEVRDENLLVGFDTADDAGVYKLTDKLALITTIDFFPPIVDDPFTFGEIAAANSLSDVYAMGGEPKLAMNVVCFPRDLDTGVLKEIIDGALSKLNEAGVLLVGGHSVEDREIKFGLSVVGFAEPDRITSNANVRAGDRLILTKPIGTGVVTSALKAGRISEADADPAIKSMTTLNKYAVEAAASAGVRACTDITGYGLLGHSMEMARGSGVGLVIRAADVPILPHALTQVRKRSNRPKTISTNMEFLGGDVSLSPGIDEGLKLLLYDPQTSGGLLMSVPEDKYGHLIKALEASGVGASDIGTAIERTEGWTIKVE